MPRTPCADRIEFFRNSIEPIADEDEQDDVYWRIRLRYSCAPIHLAFFELLPLLKKNGYSEIDVRGHKIPIDEKSFQLVAIHFTPDNLNCVLTPISFEPIEYAYPGRCEHTVIKCIPEQEVPLILDMTASQFGMRDPGGGIIVCTSLEEYCRLIPGASVLRIENYLPEIVIGQMKLNQSSIEDTIQDVLGHFQKNICSRCGTNSMPLRRCSRCQQTFYCSKFCQKKAWKHHRLFCSAPTNTVQ